MHHRTHSDFTDRPAESLPVLAEDGDALENSAEQRGAPGRGRDESRSKVASAEWRRAMRDSHYEIRAAPLKIGRFETIPHRLKCCRTKCCIPLEWHLHRFGD